MLWVPHSQYATPLRTNIAMIVFPTQAACVLHHTGLLQALPWFLHKDHHTEPGWWLSCVFCFSEPNILPNSIINIQSKQVVQVNVKGWKHRFLVLLDDSNDFIHQLVVFASKNLDTGIPSFYWSLCMNSEFLLWVWVTSVWLLDNWMKLPFVYPRREHSTLSCSNLREMRCWWIRIFNACTFITISAYLFFRRQSSCDRSLAPNTRSFALTCSSAFARRTSSFKRSDRAMTTSWSRECMSEIILCSCWMRARMVSLANCNRLASSMAALPLFFDCSTLDISNQSYCFNLTY